jgi:hypothetical protein
MLFLFTIRGTNSTMNQTVVAWIHIVFLCQPIQISSTMEVSSATSFMAIILNLKRSTPLGLGLNASIPSPTSFLIDVSSSMGNAHDLSYTILFNDGTTASIPLSLTAEGVIGGGGIRWVVSMTLPETSMLEMGSMHLTLVPGGYFSSNRGLSP